MVKVTIKQSKTDPFQKGIDIYLGKTNSDLCPASPLFQYQDGRLLTQQHLVDGEGSA